MVVFTTSGANLLFNGDVVKKIHHEVDSQVEWFNLAQPTLIDSIVTPKIVSVGKNFYEMEYIEGIPLSMVEDTSPMYWLLSQINVWSIVDSQSMATWGDYLLRLEDHVKIANSPAMGRAFDFVVKSKPLPPSFCHGDFTLENMMLSGDKIYLIDPNFKPELFQSYVLDYGKILQSTLFNYHNRFNSFGGASLKYHNEIIVEYLNKHGLFEQSFVAMISHIIRLRKYRHVWQQPMVDEWLDGVNSRLRDLGKRFL